MKQLITLTLAALLLSACSESETPLATDATEKKDAVQVVQNETKFAHAPVSAEIEFRKDGPSQAELDAPTQVVVLGTGTPIPDAYRAGSSIAVIHRGQAYVFDVGSGAMRRATEARYKYDIPSLYPSQIRMVFITHLHSDHMMDLVEIAQILWWFRSKPLQAFGPVGLQDAVDNMIKMMAADTNIRLKEIQDTDNSEGYKTKVTEIQPGIIFAEDGISVEAFPVTHGAIKPAFGFKIVTHDLSILISGDTSSNELVREKARGVDLLFHEVISDKGLEEKVSPFWQDYHLSAHTRASDVGKIAAYAKPKKLIFYHGVYYGVREENVVHEAREYFSGDIVLANDLDIFRADDL